MCVSGHKLLTVIMIFSEAMTIEVITIEAITIQAITEFATVAMNSISHAMASALMICECSLQEAR